MTGKWRLTEKKLMMAIFHMLEGSYREPGLGVRFSFNSEVVRGSRCRWRGSRWWPETVSGPR